MAGDGKNGERGLGAFLAGVRIALGNQVVRAVFRGLSKRATCTYSDMGEVNAPLVYHLLAAYAGASVSGCPFTVRFLKPFIGLLLDTMVKLLHGDVEIVKEALRDPPVRRGVALVLEGLGLYGVTVPQKLPAPFLVVWNFTNMCNLRCLHCYQRADKPLPDELTLEEKLDVVRQLDEANVAAVALSGGEPTIHPHFERVLGEIARRGMYAAVATNGWVFADIERLKRAVDLGLRYVEVSVDSANPRKHDWFRGVPGSWQRAVKALENAVKLGVNHAMAVTITKANIDEVEDILDLAESIGVKRVVFFNFVPTGRGKENLWLDLTPEEREEFMRTVFHEMKKRGIEIEVTAPQYGRVALQESGGREVIATHFASEASADPVVKAVAEFVGGCGAGRIYAAIQPNGDVAPCVFLPVKVGSLREKSFREIWEESPLLRKLRDRDNLRGFCKRCPYRAICGGCRARAYAYLGDPLGPDPGCIYNKRVWDAIEKALKEAGRLTEKELREIWRVVEELEKGSGSEAAATRRPVEAIAR